MGRRSNRETVIEAGLGVVHERGFHATGVQEIAAAAALPKGSFYSYFPSKDAFGVAIVERYAAQTCEFLKERLGNPEGTPLERLRGVFDAWIDGFEAEGCRLGCLMGNLALELSGRSPELRTALEQAFGRVEELFARNLAEARAAGELPPGDAPRRLASRLYAAWEGAVLMGKAKQSAAPLRDFRETVLDRLLGL